MALNCLFLFPRQNPFVVFRGVWLVNEYRFFTHDSSPARRQPSCHIRCKWSSGEWGSNVSVYKFTIRDFQIYSRTELEATGMEFKDALISNSIHISVGNNEDYSPRGRGREVICRAPGLWGSLAPMNYSLVGRTNSLSKLFMVTQTKHPLNHRLLGPLPEF
jgi:hypothetical protein